MSIRAGQILTVGNEFVLNRAQNIGTTLNQAEERIREVGNFETVAVIRDIPDLTFEIESIDTSIDLEAITLGRDPSTVTANTQALDFNDAMPLSVISPFRDANNVFTVIQGVAVPNLILDSVTYRYGIRQNATKTFTYRGDSIYYIPGSPRIDKRTGGSTSYSFVNGPAVVYHESGTAIYALNVCWIDLTTNTYKRLLHGDEYTDTSSGITLVSGVTIPATASVYITYGSTSSATWNQSTNTAESATHPAAVRPKDIYVYIGKLGGATPIQTLLRGVQSVEVNRRINLEHDEEFSNPHYVASDYDTPDVSGNIVLRSVDAATLIDDLQMFAGLTANEIVGPFKSPELELEILIKSPTSGATLETIYVDDAQFTPPPLQARVGQKIDVTIPWSSAGGSLITYKGERAWS